MMHESHDEDMNETVARVADRLREDVPVRSAWRDELLAQIERESRAHRPVWAFPPSMAVAAGVLLVAVGVVAGRASVRRPAAATASVASAPATETVRFVYVAPGAVKVSVVGDFNQWNPTAVPLRRLSDGTWIADVPLKPGRYAYAFVVDGKIEVDPTAPRADDGDFGANSIVMVRGS